MEPDEFFATCESEGLGYTISDYYSPRTLSTITDDEIRDAALRAHATITDLYHLARERGHDI